MAIKDLSKRLGRMERRFIVRPQPVAPESHAELAKALNLARMILQAEQQATEASRNLLKNGRAGQYGYKETDLLNIEASITQHETVGLPDRKAEIEELERRCAEAGLTDEDLNRYAA